MKGRIGSKVKRRGKIKRILTPYNIAIFVCLILIAISIYMLFPSNKKENKSSSDAEISKTNNSVIRENEATKSNTPITVVETKTKEGETITENDARKLAIKQFKNLDEKGLKENQLEVVKIMRADEEYYYIASPKNTLEIKLVGGKVTRINSIPVENL